LSIGIPEEKDAKDIQLVKMGSASFWSQLLLITQRSELKGAILDVPNFDKFFFKVDKCLTFISSSLPNIHQVGILMLSKTHYPIEQQKYQHILLELLKVKVGKLDSTEDEAWTRFVYNIEISEENATNWRILFEELLSEPNNYSLKVLAAVTERYQQLIPLENESISSTQEAVLGLNL
jgi:hypothetical protein